MTLNYQLYGALPGFQTELSTDEAEITWGKTEFNDSFVRPVLFDSTARDAGNTPTTILRAGLVLAADLSNTRLAVDFDGDVGDVWTVTAHGYSENDEVFLENSSNVAAHPNGGPFFVLVTDANTFTLALTPSGTPIVSTTADTADIIDRTRRKFKEYTGVVPFDKASAVLLFAMDMQSFGVNADKFMGAAMFGGQIRTSKVFDAASGTPGTIAAATRTDLKAIPFWFDDEPFVA